VIKKTTAIFIFMLILAAGTIARADDEDRYGIGDKEPGRKILWLGAGGYAGMNSLSRGYEQHKKSGYMGGGEIELGLADPRRVPTYRLRLNFDYMPLAIEDGPYGLSESLNALTVGFSYNYRPEQDLSYFAGPAIGYYFDTVSVNSPATGIKSNTYSFLGLNFFGGVRWRLGDTLYLVPELRYHLVREPGAFWATNYDLQIGLNYIFYKSEYKKWD
jgi:hypothetical protein